MASLQQQILTEAPALRGGKLGLRTHSILDTQDHGGKAYPFYVLINCLFSQV